MHARTHAGFLCSTRADREKKRTEGMASKSFHHTSTTAGNQVDGRRGRLSLLAVACRHCEEFLEKEKKKEGLAEGGLMACGGARLRCN